VLLPAGGVFAATVTDDKGEFRIDNLAPGTYFLIGLTGAFADADTVGFSPTFFPGAVDPAGARPLTVGIAEDLKGVSFAMSPGRGADIAGNAVDEAGQPVASGTILLAPSHRSGMLIIARTVSDAGGRFAFRNVPPGEYTIQAFGRSPNGALGGSAFGSRTVALTGENLTDVVVRVPPGRVAHGRIAFDPPDATRPPPNQVRVTFRPVDFDSSPVVGGGGPPMTMDDDFTFEVQNLNGLRVLWTDIASPTWTLKKVLLDGKDVTDTPFDFRTEGVDGLEVVLTNRAASLSGTVTDAEGKPTRDYSVVVFPSETAHWTFPSRYLHLARPNQTGQFLIKGLPGADYLAVALPAVDERVWQDPDFLNAVRPLATLVQIADGASVAITLQITRRD
jgi:protocatechuate 3,4-dioxygenase beta subunit